MWTKRNAIPFRRSVFGWRDGLGLLLGPRSFDLRESVAQPELFGTLETLFTTSCRAALYLAYRALGLRGKVVVSPLTCDDAITPIVAAGLRPEFADVCPCTFNLCPKSVREHIDRETVAVQAIYLGGNPTGADALAQIASREGLALVEDCAHALGARDRGRFVGTLGDAGCFNFSKSLYGTGGALVGPPELLAAAVELQQEWRSTSGALVAFRLMRTLLSSSQSWWAGHYGQSLMMNAGRLLSRESASADRHAGYERIYDELSRPRPVQVRWAARQLGGWRTIVEAQRAAAEQLTRALRDRGVRAQLQMHQEEADGVYTRYLLRVPAPNFQVNRMLVDRGIDVKHLRQRHGEFYQERFDRVGWLRPYIRMQELPHYRALHDQMIALPLFPGMREREAGTIANALADVLGDTVDFRPGAWRPDCLSSCELVGGKEYSEYLV